MTYLKIKILDFIQPVVGVIKRFAVTSKALRRR